MPCLPRCVEEVRQQVRQQDSPSPKKKVRQQDSSDELQQLHAAVQARDDEITRLKAKHKEDRRQQARHVDELTARYTEEIRQLHKTIDDQSDLLKEIKTAWPADGLPVRAGSRSAEDDLSRLCALLQEKEAENNALKKQLAETTRELSLVRSSLEREVNDSESFVKQVATSSARPVLEEQFDLRDMDVLGMGKYGYALTCKSKKSSERIVLKVQSGRWAGNAIREWTHGSCSGRHSHIVECFDVVLHKDTSRQMQHSLEEAFETGKLTGKRPAHFPGSYFVLALEFMDHGTVQGLMEKKLLGVESTAAITRQVASALHFMHKNKRTHNDIKPANILLRLGDQKNRLIAKLADLGLARHSQDRTHDYDLFGHTVWCMGLGGKFENRPKTSEQQAKAVNVFHRGAPAKAKDAKVWGALANVIDGMWKQTLEMNEVVQNPIFEGLHVQIPEGEMTPTSFE